MTAGRTARIVPAALALAVCPAVAQAHLVSTGLGTYYDGLLQPFVSLAQLLPLLGFALWAGGRGPAASRWSALALPLGWMAGGLLGAGVTIASPLVMLVAACGLAAGLAGASDLKLPCVAVATTAAACGAVLGAAGAATEDAPGLLLSLGAASAGGVIAFVAAAQRSALRGPVTPIVARVASSWIAAASLLQLGWMLRLMA